MNEEKQVRVCAWCGKGKDQIREGAQITHGICPACKATVMAELNTIKGETHVTAGNNNSL